MYLSIVIPAFNEADNIKSIVNELILNITKIVDVIDYEVIICDDHSTDDTYQAANELKDFNVQCIRLSKRSGSHTALRAGILLAKGDAVLCIAADGQDDPEILSKMVQKIKEGKQIVWGVRNKRNEPFHIRLFAVLFYKLLKIFVKNETNIDLANADFYLLDRKVVNALNSCTESNTSLFGLITWIGFKQDFVNYERRERVIGRTKWSYRNRFRMGLDWIFAFSALPLKLISFFGFLIASLGFFYAIVIIVLSLLERTTPGWAEIVIIVLIIGGIQMVMIGVIGEYLWRTLDESRKRPLFFIEENSAQNKN